MTEETWEERRQAILREAAAPAEDVPEDASPVPERISDDELAYHRRVVADVNRAREEVRRAEAVANSWWAHLMGRYGLAPEDVVDADGAITRVAGG